MPDEDLERRPPPKYPYVPTNAVLEVSAAAVAQTRRLLVASGRREACVFWYGDRGSPTSVVLSVRAPKQQSNPFNYHVDVASVREMVEDIDEQWRPLAQVHSHPGVWTEHSTYDDRMVASTRALSLVFPTYGHPDDSMLQGVGVHEFQDGYWHLLDPATAWRRVMIGSAAVEVRDFR